jgi:glycosyltransferase involved in cell wall biosynthesis
MWIEGPSPGSTLTQPFLLWGWAIDTAARVGTGVDAVQVWAHAPGESNAVPIFLGRAIYGGARPHIGAAFGAQFADSGYGLAIAGLSPGPYRFIVEAHSSVGNSFNNSWATMVSVVEQETSREFRKHLPDPSRFKVLFVVGCVEGESKRYRVSNIQEQLALLGVETATIYEVDITERLDWMVTFDIMVLMRTAASPMIRRLIKLCGNLDIPTVFDVDDYVFEPEIVRYVDGIRGWSGIDKEYYVQGVRWFRETLELCDYFVAPTDYLAARAAELGKQTFVIRNGLNERQLQLSEEAVVKEKSHKSVVRIGYLSGTPTHQKDFEVAIPALLSIMQEFPEVELSIQGYLDLDDRFEEFRDRVEQRPFVGWEELPNHVARLDINIAPLEIGNPFCEAKSELKYFEPALLKIPTVASATDAFRFAITNGENGFLAETEADWYESLKKLVASPQLRGEIGERAYRHVTSAYTPIRQAETTLKVCQEILRDFRQRLRFKGESLSISWVVPTPFAGSGGHRNIFRAVRYLSQFGHSVRMYFSRGGDFGTSQELESFLGSSFFPTGAKVILGVEDVSPCDALIATHWTTAYTVHANREKAKRVFYFVQDFEPYFHPMGDDYIRAENTYKMGFTCITSGPWCAKMLKERYGAKADHFRFPLDTNIYYPRNAIKRETKVVIFFARPDMPRRCYPLGVEALTALYERNPELEICLFGSDKVDSARVPFPHRNVGLVPTLDDLAELYSSATLGVAFSTTNPSLVPFEMMACGCPVVDLDYADNYINYGSRDNVMLVAPTAEGIAEGIELLVRNQELRAKIARNGFDFARSLPNEREVARRIESLIIKEFQGQFSQSGG